MRVILAVGLWAVLAVSRFGAASAQTIDADSVRAVTRDKIEQLLATYPPAQQIRRWHRDDPYTIVGYLDKGLKYAPRFEVIITCTRQATIWIRAYPVPYVNIQRARDQSGLMQHMLQMSYHNFFFWGANDNLRIFAGYQFTLESGFPDEAFKMVIRSLPLLDDSYGELVNWID